MAKDLLEQWDLIMIIINQVDTDIKKNVLNGNLSAGVRVRKALRMVKWMIHDVQVGCQKRDKAVKIERRAGQDPSRKMINIRNLKKAKEDEGEDT